MAKENVSEFKEGFFLQTSNIPIPPLNILLEMATKLENSHSSSIQTYLFIKAFEWLMVTSGNSSQKLIADLPEDLKNDLQIRNMICGIYPYEIENMEDGTINEVGFIDMYNRSIMPSKDFSFLDQLSKVDHSVFASSFHLQNVLKALTERLYQEPSYRFNYKPSPILNKIFKGEFKEVELKDLVSSKEIYRLLAMVDPAYAITLQNAFSTNPNDRVPDSHYINVESELSKAMTTYRGRYRIPRDKRYSASLSEQELIEILNTFKYYTPIDVIKRLLEIGDKQLKESPKQFARKPSQLGMENKGQKYSRPKGTKG